MTTDTHSQSQHLEQRMKSESDVTEYNARLVARDISSLAHTVQVTTWSGNDYKI